MQYNPEISGNFQLDLVKKLSFNRYAGTPDEKKAAQILVDTVKSLGGDAAVETFMIPACKIHHTALSVNGTPIPCEPIGRSGTLPEGGITAPFAYVEAGEPEDFEDAKGKIVLLNALSIDVYRRLCESGAVGFILLSGEHWDDPANTDIEYRQLRRAMLQHGNVPGVSIRTAAAIDLVRSEPETIHMELVQDEIQNESQNVVAFIKGTEKPEEVMVLTAHYDSVWYGTGAWDNATGSANLMELYRYFIANPPKRSLQFIWCGAEEQGLLGSAAWAEAHKDELKNILFCINFDMTGPLLGRDDFCVVGGVEIESALRQLAKEMGHHMGVGRRIHSSDSAIFAHRDGIPAIGVIRGGKAGAHSRNDVTWPLSDKALARTMRLVIRFADKCANAVYFPFERKLPEDTVKDLEKYFERF